ncbi:transmembrane anchor protein [Parvularcula sp. IMCC14364]|uniref:transmembrane anchor protein n=1 Tax=Parvularcula sp. IMCC14364 TaxID=3067902 RepID=UPI002741C07A|nr:transmembrane anchor protein [Parvularcula sp. IMCC14364]
MYNANTPDKDELPTTRQLLRSTAIAFGVAAILLVTVVLPAEYGIDPTRIGRVLGLAQMGEIKMQLHQEAEADGLSVVEAATVAPETALEPVESKSVASEEPVTAPIPTESAVPVWQDERTLTLAPDAAAEIKLVMSKGAVAEYEWVVANGHLNYDLHGDGTTGESTSYKRGRAVEGGAGKLTAAFDGSHGWFWRNRSGEAVTFTLRVRGAYAEVRRVL